MYTRIIYQKCSSIFYRKLNIRWRLFIPSCNDRLLVWKSYGTFLSFLTYWCLSRRSTGEISQSKSICINVFTWNRFHWRAKLAQPLETSILYEHTQFPYDPSKWTFGYIKFISHRYSVSRESLFQVKRHLWMLACSLLVTPLNPLCRIYRHSYTWNSIACVIVSETDSEIFRQLDTFLSNQLCVIFTRWNRFPRSFQEHVFFPCYYKS